jgi:hypothetical protein
MGGNERMSYRQNYHATVPYHGSAYVSYPASEKGGSMTVNYSGQVPVNVDVVVNTDPFDGSVTYCNGSIDALTGSVVAMNAAQCAVIKETGLQVSKSITDGFFGAINTELSQQLQALDSAIKADFGLIEQQAKAVTAQKGVVETDYNRISSRYVTLFKDLDNECYKRIYALDKQSFLLAQKVQEELLSEKNRNNAALNLLEITEESSSKMLLAVSRINRKTREVLQTLHSYISQETTIARLIDSFLSHEVTGSPITIYAPVIISESIQFENPSSSYAAYVPVYMGEDKKTETARQTIAKCSEGDNVSWTAIPTGEREMINKEFVSLTEKYFEGKDDTFGKRVYNTMLSMWQNTDLKSAKGAE